MTQEQKAKAYDEALERAKVFKEHLLEIDEKDYADEMDYVFPALKESEDEKIRKEIIIYLKSILSNKKYGDKFIESWIAWLEKQGKNNMGISEATKQELEDSLHKALEKETPESCNEFLEKQGEQKPYGQRQECIDCQFNYAGECKGSCAMKRGEQKSADEVEQKGMNIVEEDMTPFQKKVFCIIDTTIEEEQGLKQVCDELLRLAHDEIMQKPTWSEEDEKMINYITIDIEELIEQNAYDETQLRKEIDWLKSLKDRVQPQNRWKPSEEDEELKRASISYLCNLRDSFESRKWDKEPIQKCINWLSQMK